MFDGAACRPVLKQRAIGLTLLEVMNMKQTAIGLTLLEHATESYRVINPIRIRREEKIVTEAADEDFCLLAAAAAGSVVGVSITEMMASHLIHSS